MKYQVQLLLISALLLSGMAAADSVVKTLYVDGVYIGEATVPAALVWPYDQIIIGAEGTAGYVYNGFVGKIDEFAVYSGVLSSTRIAAHYAAVSSGYATQVAADSPLLYLRFEDPNAVSGQTAANLGSATANTATYNGNMLLSSAGVVGKAAEFHGTIEGGTGDFVSVADSNKALSKIDVTIECWIQTTNTSNYPRLFQHNGSWETNTSYGALLPDANSIAVLGGDAIDYFDAPGAVWVADGNWHHVVITYDSTVDEITHGEYTEEVMADNPVLYLRFEETPLVDSSGNNYWVASGTAVQSRPFETSWGIGNSMSLANDQQEGAIAAGPATTMPTDLLLTGNNYAFVNGDISFEFWMNGTTTPQSIDAQGTIFQQGRDEKVAPGIGNSGGQLRILNGDDNDPNNTQNWSYTGVTTPVDGKWHHIVLTYDEIDPNHLNIELYVDGAKVSTKSLTGTRGQTKLGPEMNHLVIGGTGTYRATNGGNRYYGLIDEFAIYPGVLASTRVAVHYAAGLAAMKPQTCAQAWLKGDGLAVDKNKDCIVDLKDFMVIASDWLLCNDPALFGPLHPTCVANW
jgi:hypothetical protein